MERNLSRSLSQSSLLNEFTPRNFEALKEFWAVWQGCQTTDTMEDTCDMRKSVAKLKISCEVAADEDSGIGSDASTPRPESADSWSVASNESAKTIQTREDSVARDDDNKLATPTKKVRNKRNNLRRKTCAVSVESLKEALKLPEVEPESEMEEIGKTTKSEKEETVKEIKPETEDTRENYKEGKTFENIKFEKPLESTKPEIEEIVKPTKPEIEEPLEVHDKPEEEDEKLEKDKPETEEDLNEEELNEALADLKHRLTLEFGFANGNTNRRESPKMTSGVIPEAVKASLKTTEELNAYMRKSTRTKSKMNRFCERQQRKKMAVLERERLRRETERRMSKMDQIKAKMNQDLRNTEEIETESLKEQRETVEENKVTKDTFNEDTEKAIETDEKSKPIEIEQKNDENLVKGPMASSTPFATMDRHTSLDPQLRLKAKARAAKSMLLQMLTTRAVAREVALRRLRRQESAKTYAKNEIQYMRASNDRLTANFFEKHSAREGMHKSLQNMLEAPGEEISGWERAELGRLEYAKYRARVKGEEKKKLEAIERLCGDEMETSFNKSGNASFNKSGNTSFNGSGNASFLNRSLSVQSLNLDSKSLQFQSRHAVSSQTLNTSGLNKSGLRSRSLSRDELRGLISGSNSTCSSTLSLAHSAGSGPTKKAGYRHLDRSNRTPAIRPAQHILNNPPPPAKKDKTKPAKEQPLNFLEILSKNCDLNEIFEKSEEIRKTEKLHLAEEGRANSQGSDKKRKCLLIFNSIVFGMLVLVLIALVLCSIFLL